MRSNPELKAPAAVKPKSATAKASYHGKYGVMAESSSSSEEHFSMEVSEYSEAEVMYTTQLKHSASG